MDNKIRYVRYTENEILLLKDLWIELNQYHIPIVTTFKDRFVDVSFEKHLEFLAQSENLFAYVAVKDNCTVGFIIAFAKGDVAELDSIYVLKEYRGQGIGDTLVKFALSELVGRYKEIVYLVAEGNEQPFHSSNNFKKRCTLYQYDYGDSGKF